MDLNTARNMLNIPPNAKRQDIESAYNTILNHVHPKNTGDPSTMGIAKELAVARDTCIESLIQQRPLTRRQSPTLITDPFDVYAEFPLFKMPVIEDIMSTPPPAIGTLHRKRAEFKNGQWTTYSETYVDGKRV